MGFWWLSFSVGAEAACAGDFQHVCVFPLGFFLRGVLAEQDRASLPALWQVGNICGSTEES